MSTPLQANPELKRKKKLELKILKKYTKSKLRKMVVNILNNQHLPNFLIIYHHLLCANHVWKKISF